MTAIQNLCFEKKYHIWLSAMFPRKWHIKFHASYNILLWISWYFWFMNVCYSSNIVKFQKISRPPQRKGLFLRPPPPQIPLEIPIKLQTFLFGPYRAPHPNSNPFCGGVWIVSGTARCLEVVSRTFNFINLRNVKNIFNAVKCSWGTCLCLFICFSFFDFLILF